MLKKLSVALCVASVFGISVAYAEAGDDQGSSSTNNGYTTASGQIHFAGVVTKTAPTIVVKVLSSEGGREFGLTNSANNLISLGSYTSADLENNTFNPSKAVPFQIILKKTSNKNHVSNASVTISAPDGYTNGILNNTAPADTAAENVGVALYYLGATASTSDEGTSVFSGNGNDLKPLGEEEFDHDSADPTFTFKAGLQKIDPEDHFEAGDVNASIEVAVSYK